MKKRITSALLALVLLVALIPVQHVSAMAVSELETQVRNTYRTACSKAGVSSFNGYCAWFVNWQLVILGINSSYVSGNGKDEFDNYKNRTQSSGGYYITAYPAADFDLESALNAITNNGTTDAYNILVGFEKTTSSLGSRYGHVVLIHGIVDGVAYFCENADITIGERAYPEGSVISCSIETFAQEYNDWTVLDGVIHFEEEICDHAYGDTGICTACGKAYPWILNRSAAGTYKAVQSFTPLSAPYAAAPEDASIVDAEAEVEVAGSLTNAFGEMWYQFTCSGRTAYAPAEYLIFTSAGYGQQEITCTLSSPAEGALVPRAAYPVKGQITSAYPLKKVQAYIDGQLYATVSLGSQTSLNIQNSTINHDLSFSKLAPGPHTLTIMACDIYREEMTVICERNFVTEGKVVCSHIYETDTVPPTCENSGYTIHTCTLCGESNTADEIPPLGHAYTYAVAEIPTAETAGSLSGFCSTCGGETAIELPKLNRVDYNVTSGEGENSANYIWKVTEYGSFTFEGPLLSMTLGDVNGDGEINVLDLMYLANHFAKGETVDQENADVNRDGVLDVRDLMFLANVFAGKEILNET